MEILISPEFWYGAAAGCVLLITIKAVTWWIAYRKNNREIREWAKLVKDKEFRFKTMGEIEEEE